MIRRQEKCFQQETAISGGEPAPEWRDGAPVAQGQGHRATGPSLPPARAPATPYLRRTCMKREFGGIYPLYPMHSILGSLLYVDGSRRKERRALQGGGERCREREEDGEAPPRSDHVPQAARHCHRSPLRKVRREVCHLRLICEAGLRGTHVPARLFPRDFGAWVGAVGGGGAGMLYSCRCSRV